MVETLEFIKANQGFSLLLGMLVVFGLVEIIEAFKR